MVDVVQREFDRPSYATATVAAGAANIALVTMTIRNGNGQPMTKPVMFDWWLSDSAAGTGLTATTASGAVAAGTSGIDLDVGVAKKMTRSQTTAAGVYIASITDIAKTPFKVCVGIDGLPNIVATLATASYG